MTAKTNLPEVGSRWIRGRDKALVEVVGASGGPFGYVSLRRIREGAADTKYTTGLDSFRKQYRQEPSR